MFFQKFKNEEVALWFLFLLPWFLKFSIWWVLIILKCIQSTHKKKKGPMVTKNKLYLFYHTLSCFSFARPCAWFICWSYNTFSPKKRDDFWNVYILNFLVIFLHFLVGKNHIFLLFKITQVFVLPLRAVVAVIALVCARTCMRTYKSCTCVERSWSFSLSTFYYVFFIPLLVCYSYLIWQKR